MKKGHFNISGATSLDNLIDLYNIIPKLSRGQSPLGRSALKIPTDITELVRINAPFIGGKSPRTAQSFVFLFFLFKVKTSIAITQHEKVTDMVENVSAELRVREALARHHL